MDIHRAADKGLEDLKLKLVHMADVAQAMIDRAITELMDRNEGIAGAIADYEQEMNRLQIDIDDLALRLLATQQPVASDLRFIVSAAKMNGDLERIGDLVVNITQNAHTLISQPELKPLIDIPRMATIARRMVRESIEAMVNADVLQAQSVIMTDDQVDRLKDQIFRELLTYMMADPSVIERALALILISRHLERIGDHATNIAQDVIYMLQGRDVRHPRVRDRGADPAVPARA